VHIFHGSKLTRFLLYIALNMGNSDQLKFLDYLVCFLSYNLYIFIFLTVRVLDLVSQFRNVVLVMCIFSSAEPQGVGILEKGVYGEGDGNGEISLRATWDQGGQDPITARRVPSK
jgi:hypothetical protein